ncbi:MAG: ABC transporter ATP-binding protein [Spirochaetia bacterium]
MKGIRLVDITKQFTENGVTANSRVDLDIHAGEIHALVGENGSGKSTLMHVLSGLIRPDTGAVFLDGSRLRISSPHEALNHGIGMVHQHVQLVREFTVLQNIILGREPRTWWGQTDLLRARRQVQELMELYNLQIDPDRPAFELSIDGEQKIALLSLLYAGANYIILDEPTTLFEEDESDLLHPVLEKLRSEGKTLILITHKLREALHYADRISVMRAGHRVATEYSQALDQEKLSGLMIGAAAGHLPFRREQQRSEQAEPPQSLPSKPVLRLINIEFRHKAVDSTLPELKGVSFELFPGESLAVTGIRENGLETLEQLLTGFSVPSSGRILFKDESIAGLSIRKLRRKRIAYIPTERMLRGASLDSSVAENMILLNYRNFHGWGRLKQEEIEHFTGNLKQQFNIKASPKDRLAGLSGGNIQKVIISREIVHSPQLLIFSEPSWGLDFAGRSFVYQKIEELKSQGSAVLIITSDIEEALECADRIVVMYRGQVSGIIRSDQADKTKIGRLMLGVETHA